MQFKIDKNQIKYLLLSDKITNQIKSLVKNFLNICYNSWKNELIVNKM